MAKSLISARENLMVALSAIKSNRLRSALTVAIIAIGIMALVGISTAIDALKSSVVESFSALGANSLSIETRQRININGQMMRNINFSYTTFDQATQFKERFSIPASIGLSLNVTNGGTVKRNSLKTNPNVRIVGIDDNVLRNRAMEIEQGRNFSGREAQSGSLVAIIGQDIIKKLFGNDPPIGKFISISGGRYEVVGTIKSKGSSFGMSTDNQVFIPLPTARANFIVARPNIAITAVPDNPNMLEAAKSEAEGLFRIIRGLGAMDESDFIVQGSDSMANMMLENLALITLAASFIGFITLGGAAIGLMNIMLVSVGERTREIGTRKALGARPSAIRAQFLFEAILISQLGGVIGIALGMIIGNVVTLLTDSPFIIPYGWMFGGVTICLLVGVASGYLPANKAAKMDPVEALRYE